MRPSTEGLKLSWKGRTKEETGRFKRSVPHRTRRRGGAGSGRRVAVMVVVVVVVVVVVSAYPVSLTSALN
ncbi:hypothetical protein E2C01_074381 [Portunus trituberculatus]|uniref:Uncharacterized protein n=1 Tax=Portunus trituberculatus TaxID=210409 RepID=A0A5B7IC07_PORTR|nr:hypothetical protein [Portunus trituberculatus]